jgi:hypothetical protein
LSEQGEPFCALRRLLQQQGFRAERNIMRKLILGLMAVTAVGAATLATSVATSAPAAAGDYAYCLQGGGFGYPGECSYSTYAQCQASASGRRAYCNVNPRVAYGQMPAPRGRGYSY